MSARKRKGGEAPEPTKKARTEEDPQPQSAPQKEMVGGAGVFPGPKVHIASWNLNGLRAWVKKPSVLDYALRDDLDVLCFNETKLQDKDVAGFRKQFAKYPYQYWSCSHAKLGYSGTAVLAKTQPVSVTYGVGKRKHDQEGRSVAVEFDTFYVVATYIPNAGQKLERLDYRTREWDLDFRAFLKSLESTGKGVIWLGDLNVVHQDLDIHNIKGKEKNAGCTPQERQSFTQTLAEGFTDSFRALNPTLRKFSWFSAKNPRAKSENQGWRLDYIVVSNALMQRVQESLIFDQVQGSDHHPVELVLAAQ